jgi:hypothetical protein
MEPQCRRASFEFLTFLADISDPATGLILPCRLSRWLEIPEIQLRDAAAESVKGNWSIFASDLLAVLDAMHDHTGAMANTLRWFREARVDEFGSQSGLEVVRNGHALDWARLIRRGVNTVTDFSAKQVTR